MISGTDRRELDNHPRPADKPTDIADHPAEVRQGDQALTDAVVAGMSTSDPHFIDCPPGALLEGEPACGDNYTDLYNGGCNSTPNVFQLICPQGGDSAVLCGESGTYLYGGGSYRDTDWFKVYGNNATLTATVRADFPVQLIFIYGTDCANPSYDIITGDPGQDVCLSRFVAAGEYAWIWVGPSVFNGIPCESDYILTLTGIGYGGGCGATPIERRSWGAIKYLFR